MRAGALGAALVGSLSHMPCPRAAAAGRGASSLPALCRQFGRLALASEHILSSSLLQRLPPAGGGDGGAAAALPRSANRLR